MTLDKFKNSSIIIHVFFSLSILVIAYFTYFSHYQLPAKLIWDEHFYIADAQRYLSGVMFMEMHPPLGKQLIALGEWIFQANSTIDTSSFLHHERISSVPKDFSFVGFRFIPVTMATLSALLFYWLFLLISNRPLLSFLFTAFYLFDNALIVQSRAAMLDAPQIFFALLTLIYFVYHLQRKNDFKHFFMIGLLIGLCTSIRYSGLILFLLIPFLVFLNQAKLGFIDIFIRLFTQTIITLLGILVIVLSSFYLHFNLGKTIGTNTFETSENYQSIIKQGQQSNLNKFFPMLKENLQFTQEYSKGIPQYNEERIGQHGSLPIHWPFMSHGIRYLADRVGNKQTKYLYLQGNPVIWLCVIIGIIFSVALIISTFFFDAKVKNQKRYMMIIALSLMYLSYLFVLYMMDRIFYLYHYLIPLILGLVLFFIVFNEVFEKVLDENHRIFYLAISLLCAEIIFCYGYFYDISYYQALSLKEFRLLQWFELWQLKPLP